MRGKTTNVIELNGKLYDAHTGKPVSKLDKLAALAKPKTSSSTAKKLPRPVDGFALNTGKPAVKSRPVPESSAKTPSPKPSPNKAHAKAPNMKHSAQRSKILHRKSVKAPLLSVSNEIMPRTVKLKEDVNKRLNRAMTVSKSSLVSRFPKTTAAVAAPVNKISSIAGTSEPKKEAPKATLVHEKITKQTATAPSPAKSTAQSAPKNTIKTDTKPKRRIKKHHISFVGVLIFSLITLIIVGYLIYLNVPAVSMKVAASQAGFEASLPEYTPEGYGVDGPSQAKAGIITTNYQNSENKKFALSQQQSNWDAAALKENFIASQTNTEPTTQQYNGLTIYLYDGKAAWVNAGTLYTLDTHSSGLEVDQILKLATST